MASLLGIHTIIDKIHADAEDHSREQSEQVKEAFEEETAKESKSHRDELNKRKESLVKHLDLENKRQLERFGARLNRELLIYQHNLLNDIFEMAVHKLRGSSEQEFTGMFKSAVKGLSGNYTLFIGELSLGKLAAGAIDDAARENSGLMITLADEPIPNKSGFVFQDHSIEYNCLFEDLVEERKAEQGAAIMYEVFISDKAAGGGGLD